MGRLEVVQLEVGLTENFCEVIGCPETGDAALVDPAFEVDRLLAAAADRGWRVTTILITHTHADHIAGLDEASALTGATVRCHPVEVATVQALAAKVVPLSDRESISVGNGAIEAIFAPGHTPGCICYYLPDPGAVITGDVLFVGSCGSIGKGPESAAEMFATLMERLGALPEETKLYPGHDYGKTPTSTLGWERLTSPALTQADLAAFRRYKGVR